MLLIGPLIAIGVIALALAFGGRAERETAGVMAAALVLSLIVGVVSRPHDQLPAALSDAVLLGGFVLLAVRHRRGWLYAELAVAAVLVAAQITHDDLLSPAPEFRTLVNSLDFISLALLLASTLMTRARARPRMLTISR